MTRQSCSLTSDCPSSWECDKITELCIRVEPADFYWTFVGGSLAAASIALIGIILLTTQKTIIAKQK